VPVAARPGATVSDMAQKLFLSEGTVRNYLSAAIAETGARNRAEAARRADEQGWSELAWVGSLSGSRRRGGAAQREQGGKTHGQGLQRPPPGR
jgi:hypothetical protein